MDDLTQLGRYQLQRVLGRGAMGVVYEGVDPKLNRQVAVKLILKSHINDPALEAEYSARFIREAQAVARLNHPNIVTVFDFGDENDVAFLVMELISGKELKDYFDEKKTFALDDAVRMICELLDALDYAHQSGIVHRDIKPANVMLDGQMRVKLTDFGVARLSDSGAERTQAGTMVGTPSYMSPEQIEGLPVGPRSDIFAVGIILYQFLTGEKPFHAQGLWAIQKKIMQEDPVAPSVLNPAINPAFDAVVARALAKKADDRYPSAGAFRDELKRALAGDSLEDSDTTRLVLRPQAGSAGNPGTTPPGLATGTGAEATAGLEIEFWRSIKDSDDAEEFALYIQRFPTGSYVDLARRKLAKLRGESTGGPGSSLKPPFAQSGEDDATRIGLPPAPGAGSSIRPGPGATQTTTPAAGSAQVAVAAPAAGKKWLVPGLVAGVLALGGVGYVVMSGGSKPAPQQVATPTPAPQNTAQSDEAIKKADEERKRLAEEIEKVKKLQADLEAAKAAAVNDPKKQAELVKQQEEQDRKKKALEEQSAKKLAEEKAKRAQDEQNRKIAAEQAKKSPEAATPQKNPADDLAKKAQEEAARKKAAEEQARKTELALAESRKAEDARKAEEARRAEAAAAAAKVVVPATTPAPAAAEPIKSPSALLADARSLESQGKMREALKAYKAAGNAGSGQAAKRVADILNKGEGGVGRDYGESLQWLNRAKALGVEVQGLDKKDGQ